MLPAVRNTSGWDLLVGHYLGVDHAGHTAHTAAPAMAAKLAQLDAQVAQVGWYSLLLLREHKTIVWETELSAFGACKPGLRRVPSKKELIKDFLRR